MSGIGARLLGATRDERAALAWSFVYFFALLASYFVLRPMRDAVGTPYPLQYLFSITFVCMLVLVPAYGALVARYPRRAFLPVVYGAFIACLLVFYVLMRFDLGKAWRDVTFFVWVAVFNLYAVSVFWSFMSDIFDNAQARRLFGVIAAGGTTGTLLGSVFVIGFAKTLGVANLLLISAALLGVALIAITRLVPWAQRQEQVRGWRSGEDAIGGSIFGGALLISRSRFLVACCFMMFFGVAVGTLLYNAQQGYARMAIPDQAERSAYFGKIDFAINLLVLCVQLTLTRWILVKHGAGPMLVIPALMMIAGFSLLTASPMPLLLTAVQVLTRAGNFSLIQPGRESLFTRVDREARYKSKNFIDTVVYRATDVTIAFVYAGLTTMLGFTGKQIALVGIGFALCMLASVIWVVRLSKTLPPDAHEADEGRS
jgi:AAA family ATP:ADP antiporter